MFFRSRGPQYSKPEQPLPSESRDVGWWHAEVRNIETCINQVSGPLCVGGKMGGLHGVWGVVAVG